MGSNPTLSAIASFSSETLLTLLSSGREIAESSRGGFLYAEHSAPPARRAQQAVVGLRDRRHRAAGAERAGIHRLPIMARHLPGASRPLRAAPNPRRHPQQRPTPHRRCRNGRRRVPHLAVTRAGFQNLAQALPSWPARVAREHEPFVLPKRGPNARAADPEATTSGPVHERHLRAERAGPREVGRKAEGLSKTRPHMADQRQGRMEPHDSSEKNAWHSSPDGAP